MSAEAERWKVVYIAHGAHHDVRKAGDALAAALEARDRELEELRGEVSFAAVHRWREAVEARDRRNAELEAGIREALSIPLVLRTHAILRDLLERQAAGGRDDRRDLASAIEDLDAQEPRP